MKKILITGSNGLIGKRLTKALTDLGYEVQGCDIAHDQDHPDYGDIINEGRLKEAVKGCSGIVHLGAVSRVVWGEKDPVRCRAVNVEGTHQVLKIAENARAKPWVLYASSREVYGEQNRLPVEEKAKHSPVNVYARSKSDAEGLVNNYRDIGMQTAIVRYSNVYGCPTDHVDRVIPAFCHAAIAGEELRIDGFENVFDFTHVDDAVSGTMAIIERLMEGVRNLPTLHLLTGKGTSLIEAANIVIASSGKDSSVREAPSRTFDVSRFFGDPSFAKKILGWKATISLEEGVSRLIEDLRVTQGVFQ